MTKRLFFARWLVWIIPLLAGSFSPALNRGSADAHPIQPDALSSRSRDFLEAVRHDRLNTLASFFPSSGSFRYYHTAHGRAGDQTGIWKFEGREAGRLIRRRPLLDVFSISYEGQTIGLLAHQVMLRGTRWTRVSSTRFVPPGASPSSATFVEWRRESGGWVIAAVGDESFPNGQRPSWCC